MDQCFPFVCFRLELNSWKVYWNIQGYSSGGYRRKGTRNNYSSPRIWREIYDALRDLVLFVPFKKCRKHPWRSVNSSNFNFNFTKSNNPPWVFFTFLKLYKWYQVAQSLLYVILRELRSSFTCSMICKQLMENL